MVHHARGRENENPGVVSTGAIASKDDGRKGCAVLGPRLVQGGECSDHPELAPRGPEAELEDLPGSHSARLLIGRVRVRVPPGSR
jgi:hypothetical protein